MKLIIQTIGIILGLANVVIGIFLLHGFWTLHWWGHFTLVLIFFPFLVFLLVTSILSFTIYE